jgi:DNA-directed RNA polymerase specialized sigma24 family protein
MVVKTPGTLVTVPRDLSRFSRHKGRFAQSAGRKARENGTVPPARGGGAGPRRQPVNGCGPLLPPGSRATDPPAEDTAGCGDNTEAALLARCLAGEAAAWKNFYDTHTPHFCRLVRYFLAKNQRNAETVDEIVARVWYALVCDDSRLLRRCLHCQSTCPRCFLAGVVRTEVRRYVRSEMDRARHGERFAQCCRGCAASPPSNLEVAALLNEFATTLNAKELDFLESYLLSQPSANGGLSDANVWQRRRRLRVKLKRFLCDSGDSETTP